MTIPVLVALSIGAAIALQAATVGVAAGTVHPLAISLSLLAPGLAVASVWATLNGVWPDAIDVARQWWWLPLGVLGWAIVAALGWTVARLGVATALSVIVGAQLTLALVIDVVTRSAVLGMRSVIGVTLLITGAVLVNGAR